MPIYVSGGRVISSGGQIVASPSGFTGYDGQILISGNTWINGHGTTILLKGAANSGLELCGPFGEHPWGGNPPSYTLMQAWGFNIARFPLNSASWLGQTTFATSGSSWGTQNNAGVGNGTQDPFGDYQAAVFAVIDSCRSANIYPMLDLHWGSMQLTLGGVTRNASYQGQLAFMDTSGFTFWTDRTVGLVAAIATRYGSAAFNTANSFNGGAAGAFWNASVGGPSGFGDIIFELFNEPFMGNAGETYSAGNADLALLNGGTCNKYVTNFGPPNITTSVTLAGYQAIVNGIRALGATNPIIVNGNQYSQNLQNYTTWKPTDSAGQIAFGNHPYPAGSYPYTAGPNFQFPLIGNDTGGPSNWVNNVQAILNAGFPVALTEDGGESGTSATSGEAHITYTTGVAASKNLLYTPWTFGGQDYYQGTNTASALNVLLRNNPGSTALWPLQGYGWVYYFYTSGKVAPSITNASPLPNGTASNSYSVTFNPANGAGAPYTFAWVSDSGSGSNSASLNTSTGVMTWTLTATLGTYSIVVKVIDQYGIFTQQTYSLTVQSGSVLPGLPQNVTLLNQNVNAQTIGWLASSAGTNPVDHYKVYRNATFLATANPVTLSGVAITGTAGQFSCTAASSPLTVGQPLTISGTFGGGGSISGYQNPTTYYISATNGSTTFTLVSFIGASALTTAVGTPSGLTYTMLTYNDTAATNSVQNNTFAPSSIYAYSVSGVDSLGNEGSQQTQVTLWMYENGFAFQGKGDFSFNASPNWADTTGSPPVGTFDVSYVYPAGGAGFQPFTDTPMVSEQFGTELGGFNFFVIDVKITDNTHTFFLSHLSRPGYPGGTDYFALAQAPNWLHNGLSDYGTPVVNGWATLKVPLAKLSMGVTQFHGFISGTTVTMTHLDSGPGPDAGGYITGAGVTAGTFINAQPGSAGGPFTINNSMTVGSSGSPVALTCTRNNIYKVSLGMNSQANGTTLYFNNIRWTVN